MSLKVGESGKLIGYNTNFDLSSNTSLSLTLVEPSGVESAINTSRISAPAVNGTFEEGGADTTYTANEYMQFTTIASDFTTSGTWKLYGTYTNTATDPDQIYHGSAVSFTVTEQ